VPGTPAVLARSLPADSAYVLSTCARWVVPSGNYVGAPAADFAVALLDIADLWIQGGRAAGIASTTGVQRYTTGVAFTALCGPRFATGQNRSAGLPY
jgi:hypothetical protein